MLLPPNWPALPLDVQEAYLKALRQAPPGLTVAEAKEFALKIVGQVMGMIQTPLGSRLKLLAYLGVEEADLLDPLRFDRKFWPDSRLYDKQEQIVLSVEQDDEVYVPAGNMLGKDYVAGRIALSFFLRKRLLGKTVRIITTSVKDDHLRVLWGEMGRFLLTSKKPLDVKHGGPLAVNHRDIRWKWPGDECMISYLRGMVSEKGEGMAGHHAEETLVIVDEASGVDDLVYTQCDTWAKRKLLIGNPMPTQNFFFKAVKAGDVVAADDPAVRGPA